jgi:hypothetical protein
MNIRTNEKTFITSFSVAQDRRPTQYNAHSTQLHARGCFTRPSRTQRLCRIVVLRRSAANPALHKQSVRRLRSFSRDDSDSGKTIGGGEERLANAVPTIAPRRASESGRLDPRGGCGAYFLT